MSVGMTEDTEINGGSTSMVWPTVGSRTALNDRTEQIIKSQCVVVCVTMKTNNNDRLLDSGSLERLD